MIPGPEDGSSISLDSFVGQAFGDMGEESETPASAGSTGDAAGAPPAEHPTADAAPVAGPEGTEPAERTGTPPADAAAKDAPAPDASAHTGAPAPVDADPLAGATPLTYTVNGETRTYDGIKVLGTDGAIIDAAALPDLMRRLGERDHLYETNRAQYEAAQQLERLSEWRTTGEDGKETVVRGLEGLATMRVQHAKLSAAFDTLASVFKDPQKFVALLGTDAEGKIVLDQTALEHLLTTSDLAEIRAEQTIRSHLATLVRPAASASPASTPDYAHHAPAVIDAAARTANVDAKALTEKDRAFLATQFPRYVRTVTEADRRGNATLTLGGPIVDETFTQLVKDRVESRLEMAKTLTASTSATTANAAKLAAAARGQKATPAAAPARRVPAPDTRATDADAAWDHMESLISPRRSA